MPAIKEGLVKVELRSNTYEQAMKYKAEVSMKNRYSALEFSAKLQCVR